MTKANKIKPILKHIEDKLGCDGLTHLFAQHRILSAKREKNFEEEMLLNLWLAGFFYNLNSFSKSEIHFKIANELINKNELLSLQYIYLIEDFHLLSNQNNASENGSTYYLKGLEYKLQNLLLEKEHSFNELLIKVYGNNDSPLSKLEYRLKNLIHRLKVKFPNHIQIRNGHYHWIK